MTEARAEKSIPTPPCNHDIGTYIQYTYYLL